MTSEPQHRTPGFAQEALEDSRWPVSALNLLTVREWAFYDVLCSLYPDHKIFAQVALSRLIDVPEDCPERQSIHNGLSQMVADFVLCGPDLGVVAVIELDDRSHPRADRGDDELKTKALADAGLRRVRIAAGPLPSSEQLRQIMDERGQLVGPSTRVASAEAKPSLALDRGRHENTGTEPDVVMGNASLGALGQ